MKLKVIMATSCLLISACAPQHKTHEVGPSGSGTNIETCTDSCNRSYDICMGSESSSRGELGATRHNNSYMDDTMGSVADCRDRTRSCLTSCGG